ncbi:TetR/AcrR family transcriptional regulator [Arthrobacter sp. JSM 101049]|uniref:TetR/AcrR family transcriptional regulator n=1 Tax=Arthrobacter sp. JSM 101049 TaxID=929097 RepID=UPI003562D59E
METSAGAAKTPAAPRRKAGRPRGELLSRSKIGTAALDLVGEKGYDALTMSALARTLGVSASALYNHVESKQELLQLIQDLVMDGVDCSGFATRPLEEALRSWAVSYRDVFARHTPLVPVIAVLQVSGSPRTLQMYEEVAAGFARAGWDGPRIIPAIVALESFIFGSAMDAVAPKDIFEVRSVADEVPAFSAAVDSQRATGHDAAQDAFSYGLDALLRGLLAGRA